MLLSDGSKPFWLCPDSYNLNSHERRLFGEFCAITIRPENIKHPTRTTEMDWVMTDYATYIGLIRGPGCGKVHAWHKKYKLVHGARLAFIWIVAVAIKLYSEREE